MAKSKKVTIIRPRNWVVSLMVENTRNTAFKDRKKEANKKRCRGAVNEREIRIHGTQ